MSSFWMRSTTWAGVALAVFGAGYALLHFTAGEPRMTFASPPPYELVSRAFDSELEVSPAIAAQHDGSLAVSWIAATGGRDGDGRYVGVRVSEPKAGKLGPLRRIEMPGVAVSEDSLVPLGGGEFLLTWLGGDKVYSARVSRDGVSEPVVVASGASNPRSAAAPGGLVAVAYDSAKGAAIATTRDGKTFVPRDLGAHTSALSSLCLDDHLALVADIDPVRGVVAHRAPIDPDGPTETVQISSIGEHIAKQRASCFVTGLEAYVVYGISDRPQQDPESIVVDSLMFVRSRDGGRDFVTRTPHRTPSHMILPALMHVNGSFTLLAVMGAGLGDAHASASVIVLGADGRSQSGLTRTVVAPMTMVAAPDASGYMGDSLGITDASGVTWTAVPDNGSGESHVALVHVL